MSDHYDRYNGMENLLSTNLASLGTDLISRQAAIDTLRGYLVGKRCPDDGTLTCRQIENEVINKLPSAQPERIKGRWIKISPANIYECSECGKSVMTNDICAYDFCHGCGADMREVTT